MRHKQRRPEPAKVRKAIAAWREANPKPDQFGNQVLERLGRDHRSVEAFALLDLPAAKAAIVVRDCILAELNARTFTSRLAKQEGILRLLETARSGLKACRGLLADAVAEKDPLDSVASYGNELESRLSLALQDWEIHIGRRKRIALETAKRIGATRKRSGTKIKPAHRAAIGWLAAGVRKITGSPNYVAVGLLAEVVLKLPDTVTITVEQVRRTWEERRDWRIRSAKLW